MKRSLEYILRRGRNADSVIIVGAGERGRELLTHLQKDKAIAVKEFFDNRDDLSDYNIRGIKISKPYKVEIENILYIIAVDAIKARRELHAQLLDLGIQNEEIITYYYYRDNDYLRTLNEKHYQEELEEMYYECFGKKMNWEAPVTYNEKINWEKLNVKDERRTRLTDKYLAREWVKEKIGEKYLTKLYGVWNRAEDVDFDSLPDSFAIKANNGSGRNIIVKNKLEVNYEDIRRQLDEWLNCNFAYSSYELHYKDIIPKIICEEYLDGMAETVYDYNIYCFHGEPEYIWCIKGSHRPGCQASFYNKEWVMQPFSYGYPKDPVLAPRPKELDKMLELSRVLSKEFEHVRVDLYNLPDGRILFGEMTFSTWGGLMHFEPEQYDAIFGKLI